MSLGPAAIATIVFRSVNNAGIGVNAPVEVFAIDEWRRLFEVNFLGHIAVTQTLLPALIRSEGRVYTIGRVTALMTLLARILSDRILDRVIAAALRPYFPRGANKYHAPATPRR